MKIVESENEASDIEEDQDEDTCDDCELDKVFNKKCEPLINKRVNGKDYILHIDATTNSNPNLIIGLSNNTVEVYNLNNANLGKLHSFTLSENVVGVKSCLGNENLFYVATHDCRISVLDLRDNNVKNTFKDTTLEDDTNYKPLNCFDVSPNELLICGGTDVYGGDAYILFWDVRNTKLLGAYWDSHTDDITQVAFHSNDANKLMSGSTDGLINIYNLSEINEDDALTDTLNTESSVEQLQWYRDDNTDMISCVTHTNDIQLWRVEDVEPYAHFHRENIVKEVKRKLESYCYVADTQINIHNKLFALIGSHYGDGECVRALGVDNKNLEPLFNLRYNNQRIRSSWLNKNGDILVTGGEKGMLDVWNVQTTFETTNRRKR